MAKVKRDMSRPPPGYGDMFKCPQCFGEGGRCPTCLGSGEVEWRKLGMMERRDMWERYERSKED